MGLEFVEYIMAVEEEFGVAIPDDLMEELTTPRDVVDYLVDCASDIDGDHCRTQRVFYKLRRVLRQRFSVERAAVQLETPLKDLVPVHGRREAWAKLSEEMNSIGMRWPELERPRWMSRILTLLTFAIFAALTYGLKNTSFGEFLGVLIGIVGAVTFVSYASIFTRKYQVLFPAGLDIRTLVHRITPPAANGPWTPESIAAKVKAITLEYVSETYYGEDKRFVEDLGFD